mmetsp:Transcript_13830/g.39167  ORF Transcript_13830/g.39167 Transcript_13830/m.39167 type:complete len:85 (-) Transcript_13830:806-1060(-)
MRRHAQRRSPESLNILFIISRASGGSLVRSEGVVSDQIDIDPAGVPLARGLAEAENSSAAMAAVRAKLSSAAARRGRPSLRLTV